MTKLLRNALKFQDGTILESRHRHDYQCYAGLCVDGGLDYLRRAGKATMPVEDISLDTDSPWEDIREGFQWGSYGKDGKEPLHYIKLKDMEVGHIKAILKTQYQVPEYIREVFYKELEHRGELHWGYREILDTLCIENQLQDYKEDWLMTMLKTIKG